MKIAILGSYGQGNIGDEAILSAISENIKSVHPNNEIYIFSHDINETEKAFLGDNFHVLPMVPTGIRSFVSQMKSGQLKKTYQALKEMNLVVIGGGGILYDSEVEVGINPLLIWLLRIIVFRLMGLKIVLYAVGIGPLNKGLSYFFLKFIGNLVHGVSVRDDYSARLFQKAASFMPAISTADPVWTLEWEERSMEKIRKESVLTYGARKKIGVQIRRVKGVLDSELVKKLADFCDLMADKYLYSIVLFPFSKKNPKDKLLMEKIQISCRHQNLVEIYEPKSLKEAAKAFQECEFLLLTRLHSIIIATQLGIPFVALSYSPKTDSILDEIEMSDFAWPIGEMENTTLERLYLNIMKQRVTKRKALKEKAMKIKKVAEENYQMLLKVRN